MCSGLTTGHQREKKNGNGWNGSMGSRAVHCVFPKPQNLLRILLFADASHITSIYYIDVMF
jgi:hypothetical protein